MNGFALAGCVAIGCAIVQLLTRSRLARLREGKTIGSWLRPGKSHRRTREEASRDVLLTAVVLFGIGLAFLAWSFR